jgi:hypothetical protein
MRAHPGDSRTLVSATDPEFATPEGDAIKLMVVFEEIKQYGPLPFVAHIYDVEEHGCELYKRALRREFGAIKPFPISIAQQLTMRVEGLCKQIDNKAEELRSKFLTKGDGQKIVYQHKVEEAQAYKAATEHDPAHYPLLVASIGIEGDTLAAVVQRVLDMHGAWKRAAASIETARLGGKKAVKAAKTMDEANAAFAAIMWPV